MDEGAERAERQGVCCLAAFYRGRASPAELRSGPSQWHTGGGRWRSVQTKVRRVYSSESESGRELGEGWRWRGQRQLPAGGNLSQVELL